jgi:hypothetical protein
MLQDWISIPDPDSDIRSIDLDITTLDPNIAPMDLDVTALDLDMTSTLRCHNTRFQFHGGGSVYSVFNPYSETGCYDSQNPS